MWALSNRHGRALARRVAAFTSLSGLKPNARIRAGANAKRRRSSGLLLQLKLHALGRPSCCSVHGFSTGLERYNRKLEEEALIFDEVQAKLIARLDRLAKRVVEHEQAMNVFNDVCNQLHQEHNGQESPSEALSGLKDPQHRTPKGVYLWGGVGTGKSLCMDLFFDACDLPPHRKRRVHFHNFMSDVHMQIRAFKLGKHASQVVRRNQREKEQANPQEEWKMVDKGADLAKDEKSPVEQDERPALSPFIPPSMGRLDLSSEADAILQVAEAMADEFKLLCFDEFQVTDVADALLMNKLFSTMLSRGTVVVATSNRPIDDLYAGGLNRQYFMPFLTMFHTFMNEIHVPIKNDYRQLQEHELDASQTYFGSPCTERVASIESRTFIPDQTKEAFENAYSKVIEIELQALRAVDDARSCTDAGPQPPQTSFAGRTNHHGPVEIPSAFKRMLVVPEALGGVARFSFDQLCGPQSYTGAADFQALCDHFHTLVISDIPVMTAEDPWHNSARRFITLVDQMYESGTRILCSAAAPKPENLFQASDETEEDNQQKMVAVFEHDNAPPVADPAELAIEYQHSKLASVLELEFAFERAASRLAQMTGPRQRAIMVKK